MKLTWQFATFTAVGFFSAVVDLGALLTFLQLGVSPYVALTGAFFCGLGINLWLHARLTFESTLRAENAIRFLFVVVMNYVLILSVVLVFERLGLGYLFGKIAALPLVSLHGFLWSKHWVFKI
jgi:putative flippase GtrA